MDFVISSLLMLTLVLGTLYRYSPKFNVFHEYYKLSISKINESVEHASGLLDLSIVNTYKASYQYMVPRAIVDAWYRICTEGYTTLTCRSPNDCEFNSTQLEVKVIAHGSADPKKWCYEQYYRLQMGDKIYTIYRLD